MSSFDDDENENIRAPDESYSERLVDDFSNNHNIDNDLEMALQKSLERIFISK